MAFSAPAPSCGGGQGWGGGADQEDYRMPRRALIAEEGATPLLVPPPQGGRRRIQKRKALERVTLRSDKAIKAIAYCATVFPFAEGLPTGLDFGAKLIPVNGQHLMGQGDEPFALVRGENVAQARGRGVLREHEGRHADAREPP
jgi:hypothetical protein